MAKIVVDGESDRRTGDMFGAPRRRGRPSSGCALTSAQRQAARRARLAEEGKEELTLALDTEVVEALRRFVQFKDETLGDAANRMLRDRLLRKR